MTNALRREDPLLASARREALIVLGIWLAACLYTIGYCYAFGYQRDPETIGFVLGFPDWVFWGIVTPWCLSTVVSIWFAVTFMTDQDLGPEPEEDEAGNIIEPEAAHG